MRSMRLTTMAQAMETRLNNGHHQNLSHEDFIGLLVDDEFTARKNRRLSRMIGRANFKPEGACIENIKYDPVRGFQKKDILQFTQTTWINNAQPVIIQGATGTGKTYIAEAIALQVCKMGFPALKIRFPRLLEELKIQRGTGQFIKYQDKLAKVKVLVIDDFLMAPASEENISDLLEILEDRSGAAPTIITTQYPIKKWHVLLKEPTFADAICDRLVQSAIIFNLMGESRRKKPKSS